MGLCCSRKNNYEPISDYSPLFKPIETREQDNPPVNPYYSQKSESCLPYLVTQDEFTIEDEPFTIENEHSIYHNFLTPLSSPSGSPPLAHSPID